MDLLKRRCNVEVPSLTKSKYGKDEVFQGSKWLNSDLHLTLSIGMSYYHGSVAW